MEFFFGNVRWIVYIEVWRLEESIVIEDRLRKRFEKVGC